MVSLSRPKRTWIRAIVIVGLTLTAGAVVLAGQTPSAIWADTRLRLLSPPGTLLHSTSENNSFVSPSGSLIATAGAVVAQIDPKPSLPRMASPDVNIVDLGIDRGIWVRVPDSGGQWASSFSEPIIQIQVIAPTEAEVTSLSEITIAAAGRSLQSLQDRYAVPEKYRITLEKDLYGTLVSETAPTRMRVRAGVLLLGCWLTVAAVMIVEGVGSDRRSFATVEPTSFTTDE